MHIGRRRGRVREPALAIGDPRHDSWESVASFQDLATALAWRDQLRALGVDAVCTADAAPDRFGRGDIWLIVGPGQWSRATEIVENLE